MKSAFTLLLALMIVDGLSWRARADEPIRYTVSDPDVVVIYSIVPVIREQPMSSGGCIAPMVVAEGSRVFAITAQPAGGTEPIAFRVTSPQLAGFEQFIHNNGSGRGDLQCSAEFALPDAWGSLHVSDAFVVPLTEYAVQADCGAGLLSDPVALTTYRWGDTDFSGIVNLDDLLCVLLAFSGGTTPTCDRYSAESSGTIAIGIDDILGVLTAFSGQQGPTLPSTPVVPPEVPVIDNANPDAVCSGGFICLTATASPGLAIEWSSSCGGSFTTSEYLCVEPTVTTTYYARTRNSLGCRSNDCASVTVPVNPLPPPPSEITASVLTICIGESIELVADVPPGTDVEWFSWGCEEIPEGSGTSIQVSPTETTKYFARSIDSNSCISSICTSATVVVEGSPQWVGGFHVNGFDGPLNALAVYDSGAGASLYAGTNSFSGIRQWDGSGWLFMDGYGSPAVFAFAVFDDGTGPALFSGGNRTYADVSPAGGVRKWDGSMMSEVADMIGGPVRALAVFDDGNGPALYAAGSFTTVFGVSGNPHIVKWNGTSWSKLPIGQDIGNSVYAMTVFDDGNGPALYAGGDFTTAGGHASAGIARWDGTSWTNLGSGLNGRVRALVVLNDGTGPALYAGGDFTATENNSVTLNHVGKWNGTTWSALGAGVGSGNVHAMAIYDDGFGEKLYVGGTFTSADGNEANRMAKWNGASWSALDNGVETTTGVVSALGVFDDGNGAVLYAGGNFDSVDGISVDDAAKWNGFSWSTMKGQGLTGAVEVLSVVQVGAETALYAGGAFDETGAGAANHIAKWDGNAWSPLAVGSADGVDGVVLSISGHDDGAGSSLFVGGNFSTAAGIAANNIAQWNGSLWSPLGSGTSDAVRTLVSFDDGTGPALIAGGDFLVAGGGTVNHVASWNGSNWFSLDGGMNDRVEVLAVFDLGDGPALFAGGHFTLAGGMPANYVARWDGDSWIAMGAGVIAPVVDLDVFDDGQGPKLYASYGISGQTLSGIMRWDGNTWADLPGGDTNDPSMMAVYDDGTGPSLYVGGSFGYAGGVFAAYVARWDGTNWYPLDDGMNYVVEALVGFDDGSGPALFVGGSFYIAWDTISDNIAKWQRPETSCPDP